MKNEKLMKNSKSLRKFLKVFEVMSIVAASVMLVCAILLFIPGMETRIFASPNSLSLNGLSILFKDNSVYNVPSLKFNYEMMFIPTIICVGLIWYGIRSVREILKPMEEGRPFASGSADKLRKLGIFVIVGGIVSNICNSLVYTVQVSGFELEKIFNMDIVESVKIDYNADLTFIIVALILFVLAHVFSYGEELQTESDETL